MSLSLLRLSQPEIEPLGDTFQALLLDIDLSIAKVSTTVTSNCMKNQTYAPTGCQGSLVMRSRVLRPRTAAPDTSSSL